MIRFLRAHVGSLLLLAAVLAGTVWFVQTHRKPGSMTVVESQAMDMKMQPPAGTFPVDVATVKVEPFRPSVVATGTVQAWTDEDIVARVTGRVTNIPVYPGERVLPGQLVAELDSAELRARQQQALAAAEESTLRQAAARQEEIKAAADLAILRRELEKNVAEREQARAQEDAARARLRYKQAELARDQKLYAEGALSLEELQKSRSEATQRRDEARVQQLDVHHMHVKVDQTRRRIQAAEAGLAASRLGTQAVGAAGARLQAEAEAAGIVQDYTQIRAQEGGEVTERVVSPGTLVQPGTVLLRLKRTDRVRLQARLSQQDAARVSVGSAVRVSRPGQPPVEARITSNFLSADPATRTVTVEAAVRNPRGEAAFHPGEFLTMQVSLGPERRLPTVPLAAVQQDLASTPFVWLVEEHEDASAKPVYTCVMHPEVRSDHPGKCPKCGMDLVPADKSGKLIVHRQPVLVVGEANGRKAVRTGLKAGQRVVVAGAETLQEGSPISIVEWGPQGPVTLPTPVPMGSETPMDHSGMQHGGQH